MEIFLSLWTPLKFSGVSENHCCRPKQRHLIWPGLEKGWGLWEERGENQLMDEMTPLAESADEQVLFSERN